MDTAMEDNLMLDQAMPPPPLPPPLHLMEHLLLTMVHLPHHTMPPLTDTVSKMPLDTELVATVPRRKPSPFLL